MSNGPTMTNQVALVTGAAGGIGSAISHRLAAAEAQVVLLDIQSEEEIAEVAQTLPGEGHMAVQASITESAELAAVARRIRDHYGRLDVLVNNAGVTRPVAHDDLEGLDDELIDRIFRINWRGAFASARAFHPLLQEGEGGVIVNISSIAGRTGEGSNVAYCASKAAIDSMTRSLGRALAPEIRVVSVAPGWVLGEYAKRMDPAILENQRQHTPLRRLAAPEDVAQAVLAVITMLPHTTGAIIQVDGGRPLG